MSRALGEAADGAHEDLRNAAQADSGDCRRDAQAQVSCLLDWPEAGALRGGQSQGGELGEAASIHSQMDR